MDKRVLIIGVGSIGERHLRCFGHTNRAELAICEISDTLRQRIAERYHVARSYASLDAALAEPPDAAVVCTPANLHMPMSIQLADAGVHLLIEKPLSTSLAEIERLRAVTDQRGLTVAVAYVNRLHPILSEMREALNGQRFGKPVQLVAVSGQHFPYYRPAYREIYYNNRATGGGAIQDALTHLINAGEWLVGPLTSVAADADHQVLADVTVEDTVNVIARHGTVQACYSLNQHQAPNEGSITVVCQRGTARFESHRNRWRWMTTPDEPWHDQAQPALQRDDLFVKQANMFLDAIEGKGAVACSLQAGEQTLRSCLAILAAAETRSWQTV
jgi:predicted dehydrogenase